MRPIISIVGLVLIIVGIVTLAYQGITYTKREQVAQLGDLKITTEQEKTIHFPPILGGASLVAGIVLVIAARKNN